MGMDAQRGETSFYVFSACNFCTAGLITVRSLDLTFCCKLLNKNYFQKKNQYYDQSKHHSSFPDYVDNPLLQQRRY